MKRSEVRRITNELRRIGKSFKTENKEFYMEPEDMQKVAKDFATLIPRLNKCLVRLSLGGGDVYDLARESYRKLEAAADLFEKYSQW